MHMQFRTIFQALYPLPLDVNLMQYEYMIAVQQGVRLSKVLLIRGVYSPLDTSCPLFFFLRFYTCLSRF